MFRKKKKKLERLQQESESYGIAIKGVQRELDKMQRKKNEIDFDIARMLAGKNTICYNKETWEPL